MYSIGSLFGMLLLGLIPGFLAYCVVEGKTKDKKKGIVAFCIFTVVGGFAIAFLKDFAVGFFAGNQDEGTTFDGDGSSETGVEQTVEDVGEVDPEYATFGDIKVQINCDFPMVYDKIKTATDLSFVSYDENGEEVDFTDDEKRNAWDTVSMEPPFKTAIYQEPLSSDILSLNRLAIEDCNYNTIDEYIDSLTLDFTREDFNIDDVHACTLYVNSIEGNDDDVDEALTVFFYGDNFYLLLVSPILGDAEENTKMFVDSIIVTIQRVARKKKVHSYT